MTYYSPRSFIYQMLSTWERHAFEISNEAAITCTESTEQCLVRLQYSLMCDRLLTAKDCNHPKYRKAITWWQEVCITCRHVSANKAPFHWSWNKIQRHASSYHLCISAMYKICTSCNIAVNTALLGFSDILNIS